MTARSRRFRDWLIGTIRGERSTSGLAGLRAVGGSAYSLAEEADNLRLEQGWDPWRQDPGGELFLLCAWNAFALQTTADHLLGADAAAEMSAELVPEATLAFAQACYTQVGSWVEAARSVQANAAYRVTTPLPAPLPAWPTFERTRLVHIRTLQSAYDAIAPRADSELARLAQTVPPEHARELAEMKLLAAQMHTSVEFAAGLRPHAHSPEQLREACDELVRALRNAYTLGQLTAMPSLVERLQLAGYRATPTNNVPVTAIDIGWPVVDQNGTRIGTVSRLEGEPALGIVTSIVISLGIQAADRRARIDQIHTVERGIVRLNADKDQLDPA